MLFHGADAERPPLNVSLAPSPAVDARRYFWKLSDVPDLSLRKITLIGVGGRSVPELRD